MIINLTIEGNHETREITTTVDSKDDRKAFCKAILEALDTDEIITLERVAAFPAESVGGLITSLITTFDE